MFCKFCGNTMPDDAEVCEACGGYVSAEEQTTLAEPEKIEYETQYTEPTPAPQGEQKVKARCRSFGNFPWWTWCS